MGRARDNLPFAPSFGDEAAELTSCSDELFIGKTSLMTDMSHADEVQVYIYEKVIKIFL